MKFKVGDKVMLKAVPLDDFISDRHAEEFYNDIKKEILKITKMYSGNACYLNSNEIISFKYLKHAVKPKPIKYTIDCGSRLNCKRCDYDESICKFTGTKKQVEAHIKKYWKQPKIKAVK